MERFAFITLEHQEDENKESSKLLDGGEGRVKETTQSAINYVRYNGKLQLNLRRKRSKRRR